MGSLDMRPDTATNGISCLSSNEAGQLRPASTLGWAYNLEQTLVLNVLSAWGHDCAATDSA